MKTKTRTCVKTFMRRFAPLVEDQSKRQTVRPKPARMPRVGDRFSGREWTGRAYYSKQRVLVEGEVTGVFDIEISSLGIRIANYHARLDRKREDRFARADGFKDWQDMRKWFNKTHGLPFTGILIKWRPFSDKEMKSNDTRTDQTTT